ncbi:hypothetical protein BN13_460004 [Nostocoides jenkinsii Ben 74]|uniref:Uncharacterized protein n=1 Tax=Nostocoides jenkinsii Ben 74 TaxID=1193518 RepID=A0A077MF86_9MICO|nr:hypothetical protein BN13_460004 [Tetrasphaera jenkinsii Ben 74]
MGLRNLVIVDAQLRVVGPGLEPEHERGGERPRLIAQITDLTTSHPHFLEHLARHGHRQGLAWFYETSQHRQPPRRPTRVPCQKQAVVRVQDRHDHRRVSPWEVLAGIGRAGARPAGVRRNRRRPAPGAMRMRRMPIPQRNSSRQGLAVDRIQVGAVPTQGEPPLARGLRGKEEGDVGATTRHTQEDRRMPRISLPRLPPPQRGAATGGCVKGVGGRHTPGDGQDQGGLAGEESLQQPGLTAALGLAIETGTGQRDVTEGNGVEWHLPILPPATRTRVARLGIGRPQGEKYGYVRDLRPARSRSYRHHRGRGDRHLNRLPPRFARVLGCRSAGA